MTRYTFLLALVIITQSCSNSGSEAQKANLSATTVQLHQPPKVHPDRYHVGILVTDGVYNTELTAPYDIFQHTEYRKGIKAMDVFTIAPERKRIRTFEGLHILLDYGFNDSHPKIDILVVPSAEHHPDTDLQDSTLVNWIREIGQAAEWITSHCDGAFMLAKASLLDNVASTTFPIDIEAYKTMFSSFGRAKRCRCYVQYVFTMSWKMSVTSHAVHSNLAKYVYSILNYCKHVLDPFGS